MGSVRFEPSGAVRFSGDFNLEELEKVTKQIQEARTALKELTDIFPKQAHSPPLAEVKKVPTLHVHHRPLSQSGMILSYLMEHKDKTVNIDKLKRVLKGAAPTSVRTVLSILTRNGEIVRAGHGRYQAALAA